MARRRTLPLLLLASTWLACGPSDPVGTSESYVCVKDPDVLGAPTSCLEDDDCPCGARCDLGLCVFDCVEDADCASGWCDDFGSCREEEDTEPLPSPVVAELGAVSLTPELLYVAADRPARVDVALSRVAEGELRVEVEPGLLLTCPDDTVATECVFTAQGGVATPLWVGPDPEVAGESLSTLKLWYGDRVVVAVVDRAPAPELTDIPVSGRYSGELRLMGFEGPSGTLEALDGVVLPAEGVLKAGATSGWDLAVEDATGLFGFFIRADGGLTAGQLAPRRLGEDRGEAAPELIEAGDVTLAWEKGILTADLRVVTTGAFQQPPVQLWTLSMRRTEAAAEALVAPAEVVRVHEGQAQVTVLPEAAGVHDLVAGRTADELARGWKNQAYSSLRCAWPEDRDFLVDLCEASGLADCSRPAPEEAAGLRPNYYIWFDGSLTLQAAADQWGCFPNGCAWQQFVNGSWECRPSCTFQPLPDDELCGQLLYCDEGSGSGVLTGATVEESGDTRCRNPEVADSEWLPSVLSLVGILERGGLSAHDQLAACLEDLAPGVSTSGTCIDVPRFLHAFDRALHAPRTQALGGSATGVDGRTALRLAREWLTLHAFVARVGLEAVTTRDLLQTGEADALGGRGLVDLVEQVDAGWDPLLHPRTAWALEQLPGWALASPDYREGTQQPTDLAKEPQVGLPAVMLESLAEELVLTDAWLEEVSNRLAGLGQDAPLADRVVRRALVVMSLAGALRDAALQADPDAPWAIGPASRWARASEQVEGLLAQVLSRIAGIGQGRNPLGIEDEDLPLKYKVATSGEANDLAFTNSDFFFGASGQARERVALAKNTLGAARTAWGLAKDRAIREVQANNEAEDRLRSIRERYGAPLNDLCGRDGASDETALEDLAGTDIATCFISEAAGCEWTRGDIEALFSDDDAAFDLCVEAKLDVLAGTSRRLKDPAHRRLVASVADALAGGGDPATVLGVTWVDTDAKLLRARVGSMLHQVPFEAVFERRREPAAITLEQRLRARSECLEVFSGSRGGLPGLRDIVDGPLSKPSCYRGALGEAALNLKTAALQVEQQNTLFQEQIERYDHAVEGCIILAEGNEALDAERAKHKRNMNELMVVQRTGSILSSMAGFLSLPPNPAMAFVQAIGGATQSVVGGAMEAAQRTHEDIMSRLRERLEEELCIHEADAHLISLGSAAGNVDLAEAQLRSAVLAFENLQSKAETLVKDGTAAVAREEARAFLYDAHHLWLAGQIEDARAAMRVARRYLYAGLRAVEYERQFTSGLRDDILMAKTPGELSSLLPVIVAEYFDPEINGGGFDKRHAVVSLRRDLLRLGDRSALPDGWHRMTEVQRFQHLLTSERFARYDAQGRYLGQAIPFRLVPVAQEVGDGMSLELGSLYCAERVTYVSATPIGAGMIVGPATTNVDLQIRKKNTFFSQWCDLQTEEGFQYAAVRPTRNLLAEPTVDQASYTGAAAEESTSAGLTAYLNTPLAQFEGDVVPGGAATTLLGRALYGEYELFFPRQEIVTDEDSNLSRLDLRKVEDIYLRFDFVAATKQ